MQTLNYLAAAALAFGVAWLLVILATAAGY